MSNQGWIGVDLDRTLAAYNTWRGADTIGEPIPQMVKRVKKWIGQGEDVRIFTARIWPIAYFGRADNGTRIIDTIGTRNAGVARLCEATTAGEAIEEWCLEHIGVRLPVTCVKDFSMVELWDDRAVQIIPNTGIAIQDQLAAIIKLAPEEKVILAFVELSIGVNQ